MQQQDWYEPLRAIASLGSQKEKIEHLGQLAEARRRHMGQFFTPDNVARFMWSFVEHLDLRNILDNSIGSARLLQFATPGRHRLFGVDVHEATVDAVKAVVEAAGFECEIICAGMEAIRPKGMDCCLVNPPFSLHLESPSIEPMEGFTRMGKFGADTSAISDEYAVAQALKAAPIVIALLPRSSADAIRGSLDCWKSKSVQQRLRAVFDLPAETFAAENANVLTSVVVFGDLATASKPHHVILKSLSDPVPQLTLGDPKGDLWPKGKSALRYQLLDCTEPTIHLAVTGNAAVKVSLDGRKIKLGFSCGFIQAKVENAILDRRIFSSDVHRLPQGVRFNGQGKLDIETYLAQESPQASFANFVDQIRVAGGMPVVQPGVVESLERKHRRFLRAVMPLKHTIWSRGTSSMDAITGVARKPHNVDATRWLSPVVKEGEQVEFTRVASGQYSYQKNGKEYRLTADDLELKFALKDASEGWLVAHTGLLDAYPVEAKRLRDRAIKLGIAKWLNWQFQLDDLVELTMKPCGGTAAWKQACGKSRLAAGLVLLSGAKHGLIVVESRLIDEMRDQLGRTGVDMKAVCVIDSADKLDSLGQINLISYERLRMLVNADTSKRVTYAHKLRRRIGILVADEGERLANFASDQSRALFQVCARKRYILTGTPIANYPRDIHGLMLFTGGDGTAAQPYGFRRGFFQAWWNSSMQHAMRGIDQLRDDFVTTEWVTHEWSESLREGAKREIPKLANVEKFRAWLAPHVKRRITQEPEVACHIKLPPAQFETIDLEWDSNHLAYYLKACDDFADWYKNRNRGDEKKHNLAVLLARLQAVHTALNVPQKGVEGMPAFVGMTSKQRAVLAYLKQLSAEGKKSLLYCENPATVDLLHRELKASGIASVRFHGGITIKKRVAAKDSEFVGGNADHLLCTKASARSGYNLPGADVVVFYDRSWSAKTEGQAMHRPMRVERSEAVKVTYFMLPGSLDHYQGQMVAFKKDSADAGLDWATAELEDAEFLHLSTVLNNFVDDLAKLHNTTAHLMRQQLKAA